MNQLFDRVQVFMLNTGLYDSDFADGIQIIPHYELDDVKQWELDQTELQYNYGFIDSVGVKNRLMGMGLITNDRD